MAEIAINVLGTEQVPTNWRVLVGLAGVVGSRIMERFCEDDIANEILYEDCPQLSDTDRESIGSSPTLEDVRTAVAMLTEAWDQVELAAKCEISKETV